jgi:AraC family transcriptional regulator
MSEVTRSFPVPPRPPGYHLLLKREGFAVHDCVCRCVRDSPASENVFAANRVALIVGGSFHYESDFGATMLGTGSMLLGRAGGGYRFTHVDDGGDRSVTFDFSDELLDEAQRVSGIKRGDPANLSAVSIPASPQTAAATALALQALNVDDADIWEELALLIATTVVVSAAQLNAAPERLSHSARERLSWTEERKIAQALRHIEARHNQDCSLHVLADEAGISIYRFLRLFKSLTSQTPRQYLVATRLRAAATRLIETKDKVLEIAYDVGFGDVSHFNQTFSAAFRTSPTRFRQRYGRYAACNSQTSR